jgi:type I restriction enzyme, S subunit
MSKVFPEKSISAVTKVITSPVDKKTMPDEIPVFLCNYTDVYYHSKITGNMPFMEATAKQSEIDRFSLCPNDVVITKDSESADDIGIPTYIQSIREKLLCGYHLIILRPKKNVDGRFLSLTLTHPRISYDFYRYANGITRFGLTTETFSKVKIPLPTVPEQKPLLHY